MAGVTNRGKKVILNTYFRADVTDEPVAFAMLLATVTNVPDADTNVMTDLVEIPTGNGYTQGTGVSVTRDATGFDVITEDDTGDRGLVQVKDIVYTASGGPIPTSGLGARYALLVDDAATANVIAFFDLVSDRTISNGQTLTLQDCEIRLNET